MKLTLDLENLENDLNESLESITKKAIEDTVKRIALNHVDNIIKETIKDFVDNKLDKYLNDYIENTSIKIGGGWNNEPIQEVNVDDYLKQEIGKCISSTILKTSRGEVIDFKKYIEKNISIEGVVKKTMENYMSEVRNDINKKISQQFDEVTKQTLSDTMLNILSKNETYTKIQENIKSIATREE